MLVDDATLARVQLAPGPIDEADVAVFATRHEPGYRQAGEGIERFGAFVLGALQSSVD